MRGVLDLTLVSADGTLLARRRARNSVMRGGAELVARLFVGQGNPISHMAVGTSDEPETETFTTTALSNEGRGDESPLAGDTATLIASGAMTLAVDQGKRLVLVRVRATLPPDAAVGTVREAGLISRGDEGDVLYNRVTFAPIRKGGDHELTMFWEVTFPYGDLQWVF